MNISLNWLALLIAAGAGLTMAVQGTLNSQLSKYIGIWETNLIVHIIATAVLLLLVFGFKLGEGGLFSIGQAPWYSYLGGILSVVIIFGVVSSIPKVGAANATTAIVAAQVLTAALLDNFGWFGLKKMPLDWISLIGIMLIAVGAWCILRR